MDPIESISSKQTHFTMEQYDLILNNHVAVGLYQELNWSTGLEPQILDWQAETLPLGHQLNVSYEYWIFSTILVGHLNI